MLRHAVFAASTKGAGEIRDAERGFLPSTAVYTSSDSASIDLPRSFNKSYRAGLRFLHYLAEALQPARHYQLRIENSFGWLDYVL
jgi:hypothetical protein